MIARLVLAVLIVAAAVASTPAALAPGINSADLICASAPIALAVVLLRRRPQSPAAGDRLPSPAGSSPEVSE
ncbi:hypothetical protein [Microbacterium sp. No. 7]|uniref:hypothetical protein n=1 Tax=Microbacterium sp. No. 7 TaxID=1714373 RepID=UPI0006CFE594|nr:hypothetical protein [Microbacterium sp. No. 7]